MVVQAYWLQVSRHYATSDVLQMFPNSTQPFIHARPHIALLPSPLLPLFLHALRTQALVLPVYRDDALQSLQRATKPIVLERSLNYERHPLLREHIGARHVACSRDGKENGSKVRNQLLEECVAPRRDVGRELGMGGRTVRVLYYRCRLMWVRCDAVIQSFANLARNVQDMWQEISAGDVRKVCRT